MTAIDDPDRAASRRPPGSSAVSKSRMITANAATFVATDMNAVTGVGAPS